jgi:hypothetical protein
MLNPYVGKLMYLWISPADSVLLVVKRLKYVARNWSRRVRIVCLVGSRPHLQCGHFQTSLPKRSSYWE